MKFFDENGRRIPGEGMRVFAQVPSNYYRIDPPVINFDQILARSKKYGFVQSDVAGAEFANKANEIKSKIQSSPTYSNILNGTCIPFIYERPTSESDLGEDLISNLLPNLQKSFTDKYPESHFKAILQSNSELAKNITLDPDSRYGEFIEASKKHTLIGWYFPQALQEFDVESQRRQMRHLPVESGINVCLSGGMDVCAAIAGTPELLISEDYYAPILCLSSYVHKDERLVLLLKSYGPHMEFWCMTQMLTSDTTQVSEQWAGGLTFFSYL